MSPEEIDGLDWEKGGGLLPAVVQEVWSYRAWVVMLGSAKRSRKFCTSVVQTKSGR